MRANYTNRGLGTHTESRERGQIQVHGKGTKWRRKRGHSRRGNIHREGRNTERGHTLERRLYEKEREDAERGHTRRENIDGEMTQTGMGLH